MIVKPAQHRLTALQSNQLPDSNTDYGTDASLPTGLCQVPRIAIIAIEWVRFVSWGLGSFNWRDLEVN